MVSHSNSSATFTVAALEGLIIHAQLPCSGAHNVTKELYEDLKAEVLVECGMQRVDSAQ